MRPAGSDGTIRPMPRVPADKTPTTTVIVTNPDEDCSPEAFRIVLAEVLEGDEPELDSLDAVEALHALRGYASTAPETIIPHHSRVRS